MLLPWQYSHWIKRFDMRPTDLLVPEPRPSIHHIAQRRKRRHVYELARDRGYGMNRLMTADERACRVNGLVAHGGAGLPAEQAQTLPRLTCSAPTLPISGGFFEAGWPA
jgi:hypothetical protein